MPVPDGQGSNFLDARTESGLDGADGCGALTKVAKTVGNAAGYIQRSSGSDMLQDAEQLLMRSPEKAIIAATAVGLLLGTVVRNRR